MKAGDTFRPSNRDIDIHLWVIISDPALDPTRVLIVSLTTYKPIKESACILNPGDHRSVSHRTCIAYDLAKIVSVKQLEEARDRGLMSIDTPVSMDVLKRMRDGSARSKRMPIEHYELLESQGLV